MMDKRLILSYLCSWGFWTQNVCYYEYNIGCFSNGDPFCNTMGILPEDPFKDIKMEFHLYTKQNTDTKQPLDLFNDNSVTSSNFQGNRKTVFIIHGFTGRPTDKWISDMRNVLLKNDDVNIIVVDWSKGADGLTQYKQSAANTRVVGAVIAQMIKMLVRLRSTTYDDFHLVGFSLGAHAAGYAGALIRQNGQAAIGRITGLDPAGPKFDDYDEEVRLDPSDAKYVDAIHTDGVAFGFGTQKPEGHADFYPNSGYNQPGCPEHGQIFFSMLTGNITGAVHVLECDHKRAIYLFIASISCASFEGKPCSSEENFKDGLCNTCGNGCLEMGYKSTPITNQEKFYLTTDAKTPFCYQSNLRRLLSALKRMKNKLA